MGQSYPDAVYGAAGDRIEGLLSRRLFFAVSAICFSRHFGYTNCVRDLFFGGVSICGMDNTEEETTFVHRSCAHQSGTLEFYLFRR